MFASASGDNTVKIWDLRQPASTLTMVRKCVLPLRCNTLDAAPACLRGPVREACADGEPGCAESHVGTVAPYETPDVMPGESSLSHPRTAAG